MQPVYESLSEIDHVLRRPGMYIGGSLESREYTVWGVVEDAAKKASYTLSQLTIKCFQEIMSNAVDNAIRVGERCTFVDIQYEDPRRVTITNDGCDIPISDSIGGIPVPQMLFGELRTSSNYNDDETRVSAGLNGLGSKLTNIFSDAMTIQVHQEGTCYRQTWQNNMQSVSKPELYKSGKSGVISVSYHLGDKAPVPCDERFVLDRLVREAAFTVSAAVTCNGAPVSKSFFELFSKDHLEFSGVGVRWSIALSDDSGCASMVNGVHTSEHGHHVDVVMKPLVAWLAKIDTAATASKYLASSAMIVVAATASSLVFSSQDKSKVTKSSLKPITLTSVNKKALDHVLSGYKAFLEQRKVAQGKRQDGKKLRNVNVPKLEDAAFAGTKHSLDCTLILTEGDSAKTFAMSGTSVIGREKYGIFPLRGKVLNARECDIEKVLANAELTNVKKIMGLRTDADYSKESDRKTLRYGGLLILTDADNDGHHIKGLILNAFDALWPSTFTIPGFFKFLRTPIVKCKGVEFFSLGDFERYASSRTVTGAKYFKGLGTSSRAEACDYFRRLDSLCVTFDCKSEPNDLRQMFSKMSIPKRKQWITEYIKDPLQIEPRLELTFHDFVHTELLEYAAMDVKRSLPNFMDGLKISQRKILHTLRSLPETQRREIKVAQLASITAQMTNYHHGEHSLSECIITLAQDFTGSNNQPLLKAIGQFGSRLQGGSDSSSPRYIFTTLSEFATKVFRKEDDQMLEYVSEDGQSAEPVHFLPIVPVILVNGARGIGTGFSTYVPGHDVRQVVDVLLDWLKKRNCTPMNLTPFVKGFTGTITSGVTNFCTTVTLESVSVCQYTIKELPAGVWTDTFKDKLDRLISEGFVESYENLSSDIDVHFNIVSYASDVRKRLGLTTTYSTTNMHAFDENSNLYKYPSTSKIFMSWFTVRLRLYKKRLELTRETVRHDMDLVSQTKRYVQYIIDNGIEFLRNGDVDGTLLELGFEKHQDSFAYLLDIKTRQFTEDNLNRLEKKIQATKESLDELLRMDEYELWTKELLELKNIF